MSTTSTAKVFAERIETDGVSAHVHRVQLKAGDGSLKFCSDTVQRRLLDGPTDLLSNAGDVPMKFEAKHSFIGIDPGKLHGSACE